MDPTARLSSPTEARTENADGLPQELRDLVSRSRALYDRVWRLDEKLFSEEEQSGENPVMSQIDRLRNAAEKGAFDPLAIWRDS